MGTQLSLVYVAYRWHSYAMARVRVSTTVDSELLAEVRQLRSGLNDAALLDEALAALRLQHRRAAIDGAYSAYEQQPIDKADAWGDLASFADAARDS